MYTVGDIPGVGNRNIVVRGTGDSAIDNTNLDNAVAQLNSWGEGTLWIEGDVYLTTAKTFTAPIHLKGATADARIIITNTSASFVAFGWNVNYSPITASPQYTVTTHKNRAEYVTVSGTGWTPTGGDWFVIWSNDTLTDIDPHNSGGAQKPLELHQVQEYDATLGRAYTESPIVDLISSSGRLVEITMQENVVVENLKIDHDGGQDDYATCLQFRQINGLTVRNIRTGRKGGGAIWVTYCANVDISNVHMEGTEANEQVYGVLVGIVNNLTFRDSVIYGTRHAFTTTSGYGSGSSRWGNAINCIIDNVTCYVTDKVDGSDTHTSRVGLDTHAEGWGIVFKNCNVFVQGTLSNVGIQSRSRNTQFLRCRIMGSYPGSSDTGNSGKGMRIYGSNHVVDSCIFDGCWRGIEVNYINLDRTNNLTVTNCTFANMNEEAIYVNAGANHTFSNNVFKNCGNVTSKEIVDFLTASGGHLVTNNTFIKNNASIAINQRDHATTDIKVLGNTFVGFSYPTSSGPLGFRESGVYGQNYEKAYAFSNVYDSISYGGRKSGQDALGNISGVQTIDFGAGNYDNKTAVLNGNLTLSASGDFAGVHHFLVSQDITGGHTITWSNVNWNGTDPQPKASGVSVSLFQLYHAGDGTWYGLGYFNN